MKGSSTPQPELAPVFVINYPAGYANAEMNGERVMLIRAVGIGVVEGVVISGKNAGRRWQFISKHLQEAVHG